MTPHKSATARVCNWRLYYFIYTLMQVTLHRVRQRNELRCLRRPPHGFCLEKLHLLMEWHAHAGCSWQPRDTSMRSRSLLPCCSTVRCTLHDDAILNVPHLHKDLLTFKGHINDESICSFVPLASRRFVENLVVKQMGDLKSRQHTSRRLNAISRRFFPQSR